MERHEVLLVQRTWGRVTEIGEDAAAMFYARLFELDPSLRDLFRGDLAEQGRKLLSMISVVVRGLDRLAELVPAVQALGARHTAYGVQDHHYATVGAALLWTLEQGLGEEFTPEVRSAWAQAYGTLATTMKSSSVQIA